MRTLGYRWRKAAMQAGLQQEHLFAAAGQRE